MGVSCTLMFSGTELYTTVSRIVDQQNRKRQCRKVLWVMGFIILDQGFRCVSGVEGNSTKKCIYTFSFLFGKHREPRSINQHQTLSIHITNRHCCVRFYAFVGQPLSKQLYSNIFENRSQDFRATSKSAAVRQHST